MNAWILQIRDVVTSWHSVKKIWWWESDDPYIQSYTATLDRHIWK